MFRRLRFLMAAAVVAPLLGIGGGAAHADTAFATPVRPHAVADQERHGSVMSVRHNQDGTVIETIYTPAKGVTPAQLASMLTASGVAGVNVVDSTAESQVAACTYGTARTWATATTCFARWSYNGWARPQMYFLDRSNSLWPVGRAVTKWNETSGIDSRYRAYSAGCPSTTVHCVTVFNASYGPGWVGKTERALNAQKTYYSGAYIALNEYYHGTEAQRWNTACHEIGHVLGLDHNVSTSSCLYESRTAQRYPNGDDFNLLERYY